MIELFAEKKDCCGCGACMNICPKTAIRMEKMNTDLYILELIQKNVSSVVHVKGVCISK